MEDQLLSIIMIDGLSALATCMSPPLCVEASDFFQPANGVIYSRLLQMVAEGKPIDLAALAQELMTAKELEAVGGYPHLMQVTSKVTSSAQVKYVAGQVKEFSVRRQLIKLGTEIVEKCHNYTGGGVAEMMRQPLNDLLRTSMGGGDVDDESWEKILESADEMAASIIKSEGMPASRILTFFSPSMNDSFGPMERGSLVILAARPSIGKSSLARQQTVHTAKEGHFVYFTTYEVRPARVVLNMAAAMTRIGIKVLGKAHERDQSDFRSTIKSLVKLGIYMSRTDRTINRLIARAKALHAKRHVDLIVVDHGGLIDDIAEASKDEKEPMIGYVTKQLKKLAQELDCVVLLVWQLKRLPEGHRNREPDYSDLKGSGDLEADADKILLIHRPDEGLNGVDQTGHKHVSDLPTYTQNIIQAKGRDDGVATHTMVFDRSIAAFHDVAKEVEEDPNPTQVTADMFGD